LASGKWKVDFGGRRVVGPKFKGIRVGKWWGSISCGGYYFLY